ncbi:MULTISPECIES: hypothetical protein [Burkholderia cepacia complex]|uniref:hypothetical protein n=1 Tax=Burkholderia cepacia complex TaxID=87882 RepID=UPI000BA6BA9B|nr:MULTISPECIES: hypothetical protein [Burkholderia cepacia complex]PAK13995.1 hypothetical protein CJO66_13630 [Burkholderia ubonensis]RQQ00147.1 hypothetical protein DF009_01880 [Burkholderia ubonensis]RQQ49130.1 hypothetical protein DF145_16075 [Burkholderia stagnalis]RQY00059.1 hypothetical protein DF121_16395 [Burkholderia stagnalis]RQY14509.1 hypothetical protein DF115_19170 [Burkholderia stagnalis]
MNYQYSGPTSGVTLQDGNDVREIMLHTGREVDLPEQHEYTRTLQAMGYLKPAPAKQVKPARTGAADEQSKPALDAATKGA